MGFVGIVAYNLVSGSYCNGRGASDIDALKGYEVYMAFSSHHTENARCLK